VTTRPVLLYRASCTKCRALARVSYLLTLGGIALEPNDSPSAERLLGGRTPRKVMLIAQDGTHTRRITVGLAKALVRKLPA
jgi:hypothetical protein